LLLLLVLLVLLLLVLLQDQPHLHPLVLQHPRTQNHYQQQQ
jgi:hypothetical protein